MAINTGLRRGVGITGFFEQRGMLVLVLVVHALILAVACYCKAEEVDKSLTEFAEVKRNLKPDRSLEDWRKEGFAFPERRGPEFEALRIDKWSSAHLLKRVHARAISLENFKTLELSHEPFVIDGIPEFYKWEAASWTIESLAEKYPALKLTVDNHKKGSARVPLAEYARYMKIQKDDDPIYVFDGTLYDDDIGKELMRQYSVPGIFSEDLWQLAKGHKSYPAYRWLLIGPERSGSAPHTDPLGSSAWNTLISGRKLWFLAPPYFEEIVGDISGVSSIKWFVDELPKLIAKYRDDIVLYVQHPGETMLVPSFWMHAVLNLDDTIAVTQNFVSTHTFPEAWELARDHLKSFAQSWLQELVVHREDLGLLALRMNASKNKQIRLQKKRVFDEL